MRIMGKEIENVDSILYTSKLWVSWMTVQIFKRIVFDVYHLGSGLPMGIHVP